jgi:hypothetical protein
MLCASMSSRAASLGFLFAFACALAACASSAPQPTPGAPIPVTEVARFEIRAGDRAVGNLVELRLEDPGQPQRFFRIENETGQWVGYASASGHFYRRVPFQDREQFVGMYPMQQGLARLYETEGPFEILPVAGAGARDAVEATSPRVLPMTRDNRR